MIITPKGILLRERAREIMDKGERNAASHAVGQRGGAVHHPPRFLICSRVLPDRSSSSRSATRTFVLRALTKHSRYARPTFRWRHRARGRQRGAGSRPSGHRARRRRPGLLHRHRQAELLPRRRRADRWLSPACRTPPSSSTGGTTISSPTPAAVRDSSPTSSVRTTTSPHH